MDCLSSDELNRHGITREQFELLTCAKPCSFVHIVKNPISISCGHSICKECIPLNDSHEFNCRICNKRNTCTLVNLNESLAAIYVIKNSPNQIEKIIKNCANHFIDLLRDSNHKEKLENMLDSIKTSIDVRVESLKSDLDLKRDELFDKLNSIKEEIRNMKFKENKNELLKSYTSMINLNENGNTLNELYECQERIKELTNLIYRINRVDYEVKFDFSDFKIDSNCIGSIKFKKNINLVGESAILSQEEVTQLNDLCEFAPNSKWELIYRGSRDGFSGRKFHEKCNNIKNLLSIVKSDNDYVFGVFNQKEWDTSASYKRDEDSFIFSLINYQNKPFKTKINDSQHAMLCHKTHGLISLGFWQYYDNGHDIFIQENCDSKLSHSWFPKSFYSNGYSVKDCILTKNHHFTVKEMEVYRIQNFQ